MRDTNPWFSSDNEAKEEVKTRGSWRFRSFQGLQCESRTLAVTVPWLRGNGE
jgi:hypothetical protein